MSDAEKTSDKTYVGQEPCLNSNVFREFFQGMKAAEATDEKKSEGHAHSEDIHKEELKPSPTEDLIIPDELLQQPYTNIGKSKSDDAAPKPQESFKLNQTNSVAQAENSKTPTKLTDASFKNEDDYNKSFLNIFGEEIAVTSRNLGLSHVGVSGLVDKNTSNLNNNLKLQDQMSNTSVSSHTSQDSTSNDKTSTLYTCSKPSSFTTARLSTTKSATPSTLRSNYRYSRSSQEASEKLTLKPRTTSMTSQRHHTTSREEENYVVNSTASSAAFSQKVNLKIDTESSVHSFHNKDKLSSSKLKAEAIWHDGSLRVVLRGPANKLPPIKHSLEKSDGTVSSVPVDVKLHFVPQKSFQVRHRNNSNTAKASSKSIKTWGRAGPPDLDIIENRAMVQHKFDTSISKPTGRLPFRVLGRTKLPIPR